MAASANPDTLSFTTLISLEHRLQRMTFYLTGDTKLSEQLQNGVGKGRDATAHGRLLALEEKLAELAGRKPGLRGLLELRKSSGTLSLQRKPFAHSVPSGGAEAKHPDLFYPSASSTVSPTTLSPAELLAIITASGPEYHQTASRLTALKDLPLPPADSSSTLIALLPRMAKVELEQEEQEREIAELRQRSASVVQRWYEAGVLGEGECWGEWEGRVSKVEKGIRRRELMRRREEEEVQAYER